MSFEVVQGAFATLGVQLGPGEVVRAESDACVTRSQGVVVRGRMGGLFSALKRKMLAGETLFLQELSCTREGGGSAVLAPKYPGQIGVYEPAEQALLIRYAAFLAASSTVQVTTKTVLGSQYLLKGCCSGTGLFCMRAVGPGQIAFSTCGTILRFDLAPGEERVVNNGHVVAWTEATEYQVVFGSRSLWHSAASGEGLSCSFKGPGTVFVQSHATQGAVGTKDRSDQEGSCICKCLVVLIVFPIVVALSVLTKELEAGRIQLEL